MSRSARVLVLSAGLVLGVAMGLSRWLSLPGPAVLPHPTEPAAPASLAATARPTARGISERRQPTSTPSAGPLGTSTAPLTAGAWPAPSLREASLRGSVLDEVSGQPVANAELSFDLRQGPPGRSDAAGRFELPIPGGKSFGRIEVRASGYATRRLPLSLLPEHSTPALEIRLRRASRVAGQITEPAGRPVAGAELYIGPAGDFGDAHESLSAADGTFSFEDLEGDQAYRLLVLHDGYIPATTETFWLSRGSVRSADVVLEKAGCVAGTVLTARGVPLAGLSVSAYPEPPTPVPEVSPAPGQSPAGSQGASVLASVLNQTATASRFSDTLASLWFQMGKLENTTDEGGLFELCYLRGGTYRVEASTGDGRTLVRSRGVPVVEGRTTRGLELIVESDLHIRGRVLDARRAPVAGARLNLAARNPRADSPGDEVPPLPALEASSAAAAPTSFDYNRLTDAPGELSSMNGVPTAADGSFDIGYLPAGRFEIVAAAGGRLSERVLVEAPAEGVELLLPPDREIEGLVLDAQDGTPLQEFSVEAKDNANGTSLQLVQLVSPDGSFRLRTAVEGKVRLLVWAPGHQAAESAGIDLAQELPELRIELPRSRTLQGTVRDATGAAVAGASVRVLGGISGPCAPEAEPRARPLVLTDGQGRFELGCVLDGRLVLEVEHPGFVPARLEREVSELQGLEPLDLRLDRGHCIRGVLFDRRARGPVSGVVEAAGHGVVRAGADGRFELCGLPTGEHELLIHSDKVLTQVTARRTIDVQADIEGLRIEQ